MSQYVTRPADYWIASNAISITLNALGEPNRIQGSVSSGAVIMCLLREVTEGDGLGYGANHEPKRWPLSLSPTYFNSNTAKYVYVAIPRTSSVGTQAVVVFPSEKLDIYGRSMTTPADSESEAQPGSDEFVGAQVGSADYFYVWLQAAISEVKTLSTGQQGREWVDGKQIEAGKLDTAEGNEDKMTSGEWYEWNSLTQVVTFLRQVVMRAGSWFTNLIVGSGNMQGTLTGVATSDNKEEVPADSKEHIVTPSYIDEFGNTQFISKVHDDEAHGVITFLKGLVSKGITNDGTLTNNGDATINGYLNVGGRVTANDLRSDNYSGSTFADTGFRIWKDSESGDTTGVFDYLTVRKKMILNSIEIKETHFSAGDIAQSCASAEIARTDYLKVDANGGRTLLGYSYVKVPWVLRGIMLILGRGRRDDPFGQGAAPIFGFKKKVRVNISLEDLKECNRIRCYFLAQDGDHDVENWFCPDDLGRCQTLNLTSTTRETFVNELQQHNGNVYWWRKIADVSYNTGEPRYILADSNGLATSETTTDVSLAYKNEAGLPRLASNGIYSGTDGMSGHEKAVIDGKEYHWFDVDFDYDEEQRAFTDPAGAHATNWCDKLSDIPAAGDKVVQFGNTTNPDRMNVILSRVNGAGNPDAPDIMMLSGVYTFDITKSWWGYTARDMEGNPVNLGTSLIHLSPRGKSRLFGPKLEIGTYTSTSRLVMTRDEVYWDAIDLQPDIFSLEHGYTYNAAAGTWTAPADDDGYYPDYSDDILDEEGRFVSRGGYYIDASGIRQRATAANPLPKNYVRRLFYYQQVSHNGSVWLCSIVERFCWIVKETNIDGSRFTGFTDKASGTFHPAGTIVRNFTSLTEDEHDYVSYISVYTFDEPTPASNDWTEQVQKGDPGAFKSTAFCRAYDGTPLTETYTDKDGNTVTVIPTRRHPNIRNYRPQGGTYAVPCPTSTVQTVDGQEVEVDGLTWTDGIPDGDAPIWRTTAWFYSDGTHSEWTPPTLEADSDTMDIEYCPYSTLPGVPFGNYPDMKDSADYIHARHEDGWYDPKRDREEDLPEGITWSDMVWRAERSIRNRKYNSAWVITRIKGENSIRIDLDNENDSMLYTSGGTLVSGQVESTAALYDGSEDVSSQTTWNVAAVGCTLSSRETDRHIVVTGMTAEKGYVNVTARYEDKNRTVYSKMTRLTLKKLVNVDKYDLVLDTKDISYNVSNNDPAQKTVGWKVIRTSINSDGTVSRVQATPPSGYRVWVFDATHSIADSPLSGGSFTIEPASYSDITVRIATSKDAAEHLDMETIPINKTYNGHDAPGSQTVYMRTAKQVAPRIKAATGNAYIDESYLPSITNQAACEAESAKCTASPQGVSRQYPYEWKSERKLSAIDPNTFRRQWTDYSGDMVLSNVYAESSVRLDLDNEYDMVLTNERMVPLAPDTARPNQVSTVVHLYDGATEIDISQTNLTISKVYEYNFVHKEDEEVVPVSSAEGKGQRLMWEFFLAGYMRKEGYEVEISYTYAATGLPYKAVFTIKPSAGAAVYRLAPSANVLTCVRNNSDNTLSAPPALSLKISKTDVDGSTETFDATKALLAEKGMKVRYSVNQGTPQTVGSGSDWSATGNSLQLGTTDQNVHFALFVSDKNNNADGSNDGNYRLRDVETVPVVKDGLNGTSITSANVWYALTDLRTTTPGDTAFTYDDFPPLNSGKYIWEATKIVSSNGDVTFTGKTCLGPTSDFLEGIEVYASSASNSQEPTSWGTSYTRIKGYYLWTATRVKYVNQNTYTYLNPKCVGYWGTDGENAIRADLDNGWSSVRTNSVGAVQAGRTVETHICIYDGSHVAKTGVTVVSTAAQLAIGGCTPTISGPDANGKVTIRWQFTTAHTVADLTSKTITLRYNGAEYSDTFKLNPSQGDADYELNFYPSAVIRRTTPRGESIGNLIVKAIKMDGNAQLALYDTYGQFTAAGLSLRYSYTEMPVTLTAGTAVTGASNEEPTISPATDGVTDAESIYVSLFNSQGELLDCEPVPVLREAAELGENIVDNSEPKHTVTVNNLSQSGGNRYYITDKTYEPSKVPSKGRISAQALVTLSGCTYNSSSRVLLYMTNAANNRWPTLLHQSVSADGTYLWYNENIGVDVNGSAWEGYVRVRLDNISGGTVTIERVKIEVGDRCTAWCLSENDKRGDKVSIGDNKHWYINGSDTGIKAEGDDGKGVQLKGSVDVLYNSQVSGSKTSLEGITSSAAYGDCYVVDATRHLYFYDGTSNKSGVPAGWNDVGEFKGEAGKNSYIHIAYATLVEYSGSTVSNVEGFTVDKGSGSYPYMGICADNVELDWGHANRTKGSDIENAKMYKWNYMLGADGNGYERVYLLCKDGFTPTINQQTYSDPGASAANHGHNIQTADEFWPLVANRTDSNKSNIYGESTFWTDDPQSQPSYAWPVLWWAERRYNGATKTWGVFGSPSEHNRFVPKEAYRLARNGAYTNSSWETYGTIGRAESFQKRDGDPDLTNCRIGDTFVVYGKASDTKTMHTLEFRCTAVSASTVGGTCISHIKDGSRGDFTSRVFKRTDTDISSVRPTGGTYECPWPGCNGTTITTSGQDGWYDGIPSGNRKVWTSVRTFRGDGTETTWSLPQVDIDNDTLDVEYSDMEQQPSKPTGNPGEDRSSQKWYDPKLHATYISSHTMIWRAERKVSNGAWESESDWVITRIYGEKGDRGLSLQSYVEYQEAWGSSNTTYPTSGWASTTPAKTARYLWRRSRTMTLNTTTMTYTPGSWENYVCLSGADGTSINVRDSLSAVVAYGGTLPTSGMSSGDLGVKQGDNKIYRYNGSAWSASATAADGDSFTVVKDCTIDLDGDGMSENIKNHMIMWSAEAHTANAQKGWIDLGMFKGADGATFFSHVAWATSVTLGTPPEPWRTGQKTVPNATAVTGFSPAWGEGKDWMGVLVDRIESDGDASQAIYYTWKNTRGVRGNFKSTVYRRSDSDISSQTLTGGSYDTPWPGNKRKEDYPNDSTVLWYDGIPTGTAKLWASVCTFNGNGTSTGWSAPQPVSDTADLDIEFSPSATPPNAPSGTAPFSNHESEGWFDPSSPNFAAAGQMIWRAECKVSGASYELGTDGKPAWVISRIYGEEGDPGQSVYTATAFKRSNTKPAATGGNYATGKPSESGWSDGIPTGTAPVWMAQRVLTSNGQSPQQSTWNVSLAKDIEDQFDIEFSPSTTKPNPPDSSNSSQGRYTGVYDYDGSGTYKWFDPTLDASRVNWEKMIWMATRERYYDANGVPQWSSWVIVRVKGESGGQTRSMQSWFRAEATRLATPPALNNQTTPTNYYQNEDPSWSETKKYLYCAEKYFLSDGSFFWNGPFFYSEWADQGPKGDPAYNVSVNPSSVTFTQSYVSDDSVNGSTAWNYTQNNPAVLTPYVSLSEDTANNLVTSVNVISNYCVGAQTTPIVTTSIDATNKVVKILEVTDAARQGLKTQGYIVLRITADGNTFDVTVPIAVNYVATYLQTIFADRKGEFAQDIETEITKSGTFVVNNETYQSVVDAAHEAQEWKHSVQDDVADISDINSRVNNAEESLQTLTKSVNGIVVAQSEIEQTAKNISLSVTSLDENTAENLLADPTFENVSIVSAGSSNVSGWWSKVNSGSVVAQTNGDNCYRSEIRNANDLTQFLNQYLYHSNAAAQRVEPAKWYTLSFYVRNTEENILAKAVSTTTSAYVTVRSLYLVAGVTYHFTFLGRVSLSGYKMKCRLYLDDSYKSEEVELGMTTDNKGYITFTPSTSGIYGFQYMSPNNNVTVHLSGIWCDMSVVNMYFNTVATLFDSSEMLIVDGVKKDASTAKSGLYFTAGNSWTRHSVTFKTKSSLSGSIYFCFRASTSNVPVCIYHPRLVADMNDGLKRTGIDIEAGKIDMTADNFTLRNNAGEQTMGVDENGNVEVSGTIKAENFYHKCVTFWPTENYSPMQRQYMGANSNIFVHGRIYDQSYLNGLESTNSSAFSYYNTNKSSLFIPCTGTADVVNVTTNTSTNFTDSDALMLPDPAICKGKRIELHTYNQNKTANLMYVHSTAELEDRQVMVHEVYPAAGVLTCDNEDFDYEVILGHHYNFLSTYIESKNNWVWWCIEV